MTAKRFHYHTCCVHSDARSIHDMTDRAREITLATFRKRCETLEWETGLGYERDGRGGLPLSRDWHVSYFKSHYRGKPCYYARHSAIEHIFTEAAA